MLIPQWVVFVLAAWVLIYGGYRLWFAFRRRNLRDQQLLPHSAAEHRGILKAIASGDSEQAGRTMFDHVMESKERALKGDGVRQPMRARAGKKG